MKNLGEGQALKGILSISRGFAYMNSLFPNAKRDRLPNSVYKSNMKTKEIIHKTRLRMSNL